MFNKPTFEACSLNKCSCLAHDLGMTKFITITAIFGHTLLCYLSLTWMFNKPTSVAGLLNKRSS
jgi:hypothetical protein